jgi:UDP-N-acetylmuramyl pentapeptide phosphotransferase/UDP-N-acetylglucosamine-1-phosphate transferase
MSANLDLWSNLSWLAPFSVAAAIISYCMIFALHPLFVRYTLALPNARSSHRNPTPQGGGFAVVVSTIVVVEAGLSLVPWLTGDHARLASIFAATVGLAVVGATDDVSPMEALPRLFFQAVGVLIVILALPGELHVISMIPQWAERVAIFFALLWFVNLVNFMDGADWMIVVEVVPVTLGLTLLGLGGALPMYATLTALSLCGAMIGFAPFNRPVARLFLGDVGSLPIGLLLGWLLVLLAGGGHLVAALLLPLFYLADATITLMRRLANGEQVMQAHRSHFYQQALDGGLKVYEVVGRVFLVNIILVALAFFTLTSPLVFQIIALACGCSLVGALLWNFSRANSRL